MTSVDLASYVPSDRKPRIALWYSNPGNHGGTGRVATALANRLSEDFETYLLASHGAGQEPYFPLDSRIQRYEFSENEQRIRQAMSALYKPVKNYLRDNDIDIVLLIGNMQAFKLLPLIATSRKPAYVYCDHGALMNQWEHRDMRILYGLTARLCDATVTLTDQTREAFVEKYHLSSQKVHTIYNWVDSALIDHAVSYDLDAKCLVWAGRLSEEKGVDFLLDIATKVLPSHPDWQWHVFGAGDLETFFIAETKKRGLESQLILKGYTPDITSRLSEYAAVTLTSYREGLPLILLEGKASKIPLISFDVISGPREIINNGIDGFLVDAYDTVLYAERLTAMMEDKDLRKRMSIMARNDIGRFEQETVYAQWKQLIQQFL